MILGLKELKFNSVKIKVVTRGAFQKSELAARTSHFENQIGFILEFLMKNDFLRAYCLGFDCSG